MPTTNGVWRPHEWRDWEIELVGPGLTSLGPLDEAVGATAVWAQYGHGDGSLALHINSDMAAALLSDGMFFLRFIRDGQWLRDFMLAKDDRGYTTASQYVDEYIEIALAPLDAILRQRMVYNVATPLAKFITPELPIDDAFKWIVDQTCGPNALDGPGAVSRVLPGLAIAADLSAHATLAEIDSAHKMDLFEFLQKFGPTWGVDWRVRLNRTTGDAYELLFETIYPARGTDKTYTNGAVVPILLNDASGEIRQAKRHRPALGFANVIIAKNLQSEVQDAASVALYGRREYIADSNDPQRMAALLLERAQRLGYEVVFTESAMMTVGQGLSSAGEFGIGDEVTVAVQHLALPSDDQFVKEVRFKLAGVPEEVTITFGEHEKTLPEKVSEASGGGAGDDPWEGDCLWVRDSSGTPLLRQRYLGDELRIQNAAGDDLFYVDANGNIGGAAYGGGAYLTLNFAGYDFGTVLTNGLHSIHMSGDIKSYGSASYIYWTQAGDGIYSRFLQTTNNADPAAGATGFYVDENGNTTWKAAAQMSWEGVPYRMPTSAPAAAGYTLGYVSGTTPYQLGWAAPGVTAVGNGTAQYQVLLTGASPFTPAWHTTSAAPGAAIAVLRSDASGYLKLPRFYTGTADYLYSSSDGEIRVKGANYAVLYGSTGFLVVGASAVYPKDGLDLGILTTNDFKDGFFTGTVYADNFQVATDCYLGSHAAGYTNLYATSYVAFYTGGGFLCFVGDNAFFPASATNLDIGKSDREIQHIYMDGTIYIDADTNLYRSAANMLKTDDGFTAATVTSLGDVLFYGDGASNRSVAGHRHGNQTGTQTPPGNAIIVTGSTGTGTPIYLKNDAFVTTPTSGYTLIYARTAGHFHYIPTPYGDPASYPS